MNVFNAELVSHLTRMFPRHSAYSIVTDVAKLERSAKKLHRLSEIACERDLTDKETKLEAKIEQEVMLLINDHYKEVKVSFNSDPRGCAIKLQHSNLPSNGWDECFSIVHNT